MKKVLPILCLILPYAGLAQLFFNASDQLPNNGAKSASMDVQVADLDSDGDLDIVLANEFQANTILINDGKGNFTNGTAGNLPQPSKDSEDVAIADFNNDGHLDLVFCSEDDVTIGRTNVHEFYLGDGNGKFTTAAFQLPDSEANAVIAADINNDDLPDLLFGNDGPTGVLINKGDGTFSIENNRVPSVNRTTQDLALADVDGDGDLDLFEGNENGNVLYINNGSGQFSNETTGRLPNLNIETRKVTFGDIDGDNDLDIFLSNVAFIPGRDRQNRLLLNDGTGRFSDVTVGRLPSDFDHTIDAIFEDVDNDNDLDLIVANVFGGPIKVYGNDGKGNFTTISQNILGQAFFRDALGVIAADLNGNGLRDIYICDRFQQANNGKDLLLLRNDLVSSTSAITQENSISIYPNPCSSHFFIKGSNMVPDSILLRNEQGIQTPALTSVRLKEDLFRVDLANQQLPSGIYLLEIGNKTHKVMIQ